MNSNVLHVRTYWSMSCQHGYYYYVVGGGVVVVVVVVVVAVLDTL